MRPYLVCQTFMPPLAKLGRGHEWPDPMKYTYLMSRCIKTIIRGKARDGAVQVRKKRIGPRPPFFISKYCLAPWMIQSCAAALI